MKRKSVKAKARKPVKTAAKRKPVPAKKTTPATAEQLAAYLHGLVLKAEREGHRDEPEIMKARDLLNKSTKI